MPPLEDIKHDFHTVYEFASLPLPAFEYLIHLRHYGFPSPLLDWSRNLGTAACFAFGGAEDTPAVSIYAFCEMPDGSKPVIRERPTISSLPHEIYKAARHSAQSAEYTYCYSLYGEKDLWLFTPHEVVLTLDQRPQDCLMQFVLPSSERTKVLQELKERGITRDGLLQPTELDNRMRDLIERVFGPGGLAESLRIR